jgi:hypothetical protein
MRSSTMAGGAGAHARHPSDFYITPPEVTRAFLRYWGPLWPSHVWEPACGQGHMSKVIEESGRFCLSTDLVYRGCGMPGVDFLKAPLPAGIGAIMTNPPFNLAEEFILHARSMGVPFMMVLKGTFWHTKAHADLMIETGPEAVMPLTWRPAMAPDRGGSPTMEFCITVWAAEWIDAPPQYIPLFRNQSG